MSDGKSAETPDLGQSVVNGLVREMLAEQRRARRWGIFFKCLLALYLLALLLISLPQTNGLSASFGDGDGFTALVDMEGVIASDSEASADAVAAGLRAAFGAEGVAAVILRIDSPGGSPVQAGRIVDEIKRLRGEYPDIKLYAVLGDVCASGGYYVASAADEIYADKASLVGSIGVSASGFGFVGALEKLGVERRLMQAGEDKAFLDPFSPLKSGHLEHMETVLESVHQQFKRAVIEGRRGRLAQSGAEVFSGLVWTGEQAVKMGLTDGLGSASYVAREIVGQDRIVDFTATGNFAERLVRKFGAQIAEDLAIGIGRVSGMGGIIN